MNILLKYLKKEIIKLDSRINQRLSEKEIKHLVGKNLDLGKKNGFKFHCDLYGFGIQYTFFEEIEEERTGSRPNDVFFSLMIFAQENHIKIEQSISGIDERNFPDIEFLYAKNQDYSHLFNFNQIEEILLKTIQDFLNDR